MWALVNRTPFAAERAFTRDMNGGEVWIVVVKGTFNVRRGGSLVLHDEQMPVCLSPDYWGKPGHSSLKYELDLVTTKPATDVILHGQAHAPRGRPVQHLEVALTVEKSVHSLIVHGDRYWRPGVLGPAISKAEPFTVLPIRYERAFGGVDLAARPDQEHRERRNPIGLGFSTERSASMGQRLPNVEKNGEPISSWKQRPSPAGFGPIARDWSPRVELAGTYDQGWEDERQPLLPHDFDARFFNFAPKEQQVVKYLHGGESIRLLHMTPEGDLQMLLPRVRLTFETHFGSEVIEHRARLHTVVIEPELMRVLMVWHTHLPCHNKETRLDRTIIGEKTYL